jgi:hypothetical protein
MVQAKTFTVVLPNAVTIDVGEVGEVIEPAPEINVQLPVPIAGTLAAIVSELAQTDCEGPALETVGGKYLITATVDELGGQTPFPIVH